MIICLIELEIEDINNINKGIGGINYENKQKQKN